MEIIGRGFLAANLTPVADRHPHATVLAAGVSTTVADSEDAFRREAALVRETAARCRSRGRLLVFFSSASHAVYGSPTEPADEAFPVRPTSPYGRHKLALEQELREAGADWITLRLSHAVGPFQRGHQLLPSLVRQVRSGYVQVLRGVHRDLVDVRDVVATVDGLLAAEVRNETVNIASGTPYAVEDIVDGVARRLGTSPVRTVLDVPRVRTVVSVAKLRQLVPEACPAGGRAYLERLLDRYVTVSSGHP